MINFSKIVTTKGLKALAHKKMFADYDEFLKIQLNLYKEEEQKNKENKNKKNLPCIINFIIINSLMAIVSCNLYYLGRKKT
jgi:hypothetical protein